MLQLLITTVSSAAILKSNTDNNRLSNLSDDGVHKPGVIIGRDENADAVGFGLDMDSVQPAMIKKTDYVIDIILPTILIAILFVGNAIIVYIIFQYRKRKAPTMNMTQEMKLRSSPSVPQV